MVPMVSRFGSPTISPKTISNHSATMSKHRPLVRPRPHPNHAQLHGGVHPLDPLTHRTQRFQPLPPPLGEPPYRFNLADHFPDIAGRVGKAQKIIFHVVGDTGGIKDPEKQRYVATEMKKDLNRSAEERPVLFFHLGDVIYFNGETAEYYPQFYEPYDHYDAPIFAIPGNHDGDPLTPDQTSLDGWVRYFMTPQPVVDPLSQDAPRLTQTQPNVYFTFEGPYVTIVGMYTNVPEGGSIDSVQQQWFTNEIAQADPNKALLVALHHPIYSFDDHHSGSPRMADVLQNAVNDTRRIPNAVLTAHVHNYQRIHQKIGDHLVPFIVSGNGGYHHLHGLHSPVNTQAADVGVTLEFADANRWGYLTLTIDDNSIRGISTLIDKDGNVTRTTDAPSPVDSFEYAKGALYLTDGQAASL
jgi:hypothetical protein